jgi:drug/metabolite transporter (DMT)-like permease
MTAAQRVRSADALASASRADLVGIAAMAGGASLLMVNDTFVKLAAATLPMSEVIFLRALVATTLLMLVARMQLPADAPWPRLTRALIVRGVFEVACSFAYLYALQLIPIGDLGGLQQIIPLAILAGAALVFHERIGWQGWAAALVGLCGALLIVRPGASAMTGANAALGVALAVLAVVFQVVRDLLTRALPNNNVPPAFVAGTSQAGMIIAGLCLAPFDAWAMPSLVSVAQTFGAAVLLAIANIWLVIAMRTGRIGVVGPFRYAGLLVALASGWLVWGEFPDALSLAGSGVIVLSGLASLWLRQHR